MIDGQIVFEIILFIIGIYTGWWFTYKYLKNELKPFWKKSPTVQDYRGKN